MEFIMVYGYPPFDNADYSSDGLSFDKWGFAPPIKLETENMTEIKIEDTYAGSRIESVARSTVYELGATVAYRPNKRKRKDWDHLVFKIKKLSQAERIR